MWTHPYVHEKIRDLEVELALHAAGRPRPQPRPLVVPLVGSAGRALRRLGERLESWGSLPPAAEGERMPLLVERDG